VKRLAFLSVLLICGLTHQSNAQADGESDAARKALGVLLSASRNPLKAGTSCYGVYNFGRVPVVGDLVATQLASLDRGENVVTGSCGADGACTITIRHAFKEDVSSAIIRFRARNGRVVMNTLACIITP
jgi:hypothetical protein